MQLATTTKIVSSPGYFGKRRREIENQLNDRYGNLWRECWLVDGMIFDFEEAVILYDDAYYEFIKAKGKDFIEWLTSFGECYDSYTSNIRCGVKHDPTASPRHIQDVSVRRALIRLGTYFKHYKGPKEELYDEQKELLRIRSIDTNGYVLMPGHVPFHLPNILRRGSKLSSWCQADSVEAFWQGNKVIIVVQCDDNDDERRIFYDDG